MRFESNGMFSSSSSWPFACISSPRSRCRDARARLVDNHEETKVSPRFGFTTLRNDFTLIVFKSSPSEPWRRASARRFRAEWIDPLGLTRIFLETSSTLCCRFHSRNRIDVVAKNDQVVAKIKLGGEPDDRRLAKSYLIRSDTLKKFHSQVLPSSREKA